MISVGLIEADEDFRLRVRQWIASRADLKCVWDCDGGKEACVRARRNCPDVILLNSTLGSESGVECAARLISRHASLRIVMLAETIDDHTLFAALKGGVGGYLLKQSGREQILRAIVEVHNGGAPLSSEVARRLVESFRGRSQSSERDLNISHRESQVLDLLSEGISNKQIADRLGISYETVCVHLRRIYDKLSVRTRTEAVIKYLNLARPAAIVEARSGVLHSAGLAGDFGAICAISAARRPSADTFDHVSFSPVPA